MAFPSLFRSRISTRVLVPVLLVGLIGGCATDSSTGSSTTAPAAVVAGISRALDGSGNNLADPTLGQAGNVYTRIAEASYADDLGELVERPNERYLSNRIFNDSNQSWGPKAYSSRTQDRGFPLPRVRSSSNASTAATSTGPSPGRVWGCPSWQESCTLTADWSLPRTPLQVEPESGSSCRQFDGSGSQADGFDQRFLAETLIKGRGGS